MDCSGKAVREGEQNTDCRACLVALRASVSIACPAGRRENCGSTAILYSPSWELQDYIFLIIFLSLYSFCSPFCFLPLS